MTATSDQNRVPNWQKVEVTSCPTTLELYSTGIRCCVTHGEWLMKRIVICADGTWNRPEKDLEKDLPTNVLKIARAISTAPVDGVEQVVFYDWGLGSYHSRFSAGTFG